MPSSLRAQTSLARADVAGNRSVPGAQPDPITTGPFTIAPSARLIAGSDTNVFNANIVRRSDGFLVIVPRLDASAARGPLSMRLSLDARFTRYRRYSQNDADEFAVQATPLWQSGDGSAVSLSVGNRRVAERRGGISLSLLGFDRETFREPNAELSMTVQGSRLKLTTSASVARRRYAPLFFPKGGPSRELFDDPAIAPLLARLTALVGGIDSVATGNTPIDQSFRNTVSTTVASTFGNSNQGVLNPYLSFVASRINGVETGICCERDSRGVSVLGGVRSDALRVFAVDVAAGFRVRRFSSPAFADFKGFTYNADLQWYPTPLITVRYRATQDQRNSGLAAVAGVRVNTGVLNIFYEPVRRTVLTFERLAERERFDEIDLTTRRYVHSLRATHIVGPGLDLDVEAAFRKRRAKSGLVATPPVGPTVADLLRYRGFAVSVGLSRRW